MQIGFSAVFLTLTFALTARITRGDAKEPNSTVSFSENNIVFELPDLTLAHETETDIIQLEAFKSAKNDKLLTEKKPELYGELVWVTIGNPLLLKTLERKTNIPRLFHFLPEGFHTYIEMLTSFQRRLFAENVKNKFKIDIKPSQIVNLVLSKFECSIILYDEQGNKYLLKGFVSNFRNFPLRLDFWIPKRARERILFEARYKQIEEDGHGEFFLDCQIASRGQQLKTNKLTVTFDQLNQLDTIDRLFGDSAFAYVTRNQLSTLAVDLYSALNIIEEYEMPEYEFNSEFIDELIRQTAAESFRQIPIDDVLSNISSYGLSFDATDLKPDVIKSELGSILKIDKRDSKDYIKVDDQFLANYQNDSLKNSVGSGSGGGVLGLISGKASIDTVLAKSNEWLTSGKSSREQLNELNTLNQNEIRWQIDGTRIIPKSLNVARLSRAAFKRSLSFARIRKKYYEAPFQRKFGLYTSHAISLRGTEKLNPETVLDEIEKFNSRINKFSTDIESVRQEISTNRNSVQQQFETFQNVEVPKLQSAINGALADSNSRVRACRICFHESEGSSQCQGPRDTCSGWSTSPHWSEGFRDDTDNRAGGCRYHWKIECTR